MDNQISFNQLSQYLRFYNLEQKEELSQRLEFIGQVLDITPTQFEMARERYEAIGRWLDENESPIKPFRPQIQPQGSFRLGTVIRPLAEEDQFDVDLICLLALNPLSVTQSELKQMVGDRLKSNAMYKEKMDEEGRRCWTVIYAESTRFHMDILPAIPDPQKAFSHDSLQQSAILITDTTDSNYKRYSSDWPHSNPIGFASWFLNRAEQYDKNPLKNNMIVENKVEPLKEQYLIKTPLQRAIQLLKRHRDMMFTDDEDKPISIIITTLVAYSYQGTDNVLDTLGTFFSTVHKYLGQTPKGAIIIPNPVDPKENFADKWEENPRKKENFFRWLAQADVDFANMTQQSKLKDLEMVMKKAFSEQTMIKAWNLYGKTFQDMRGQGRLHISSSRTLTTMTTGLNVNKHQFYGDFY